jgi:hypothetical protein
VRHRARPPLLSVVHLPHFQNPQPAHILLLTGLRSVQAGQAQSSGLMGASSLLSSLPLGMRSGRGEKLGVGADRSSR